MSADSLPLSGGNFLLVGGNGFVGRGLCRHLLEHHAPASIWIVDNLLSSTPLAAPRDPIVRMVYASIAEDSVLDSLPKEWSAVFHLACYHGNQSSIADPIADHQHGTYATLKLFEHLANTSKVGKLVYAAAGCAVAEKTYGPATATPEDAPVSLRHDSPYSISKLIGEMYGNYYFARLGLPYVAARFQNVYGPGEILGAGRWRGTEHTVWRNVTPTFVWKAIHGESLPLHNGGLTSRDFIYVDDIAAGLAACASNGKPGSTYNIASGVETTIADLAATIDSLCGNAASRTELPARDWDRSGRRFGDTSKSKIELGFEARVSLGEGLRRTVDWTRENRELIASCMLQHVHRVPAVERYRSQA